MSDFGPSPIIHSSLRIASPPVSGATANDVSERAREHDDRLTRELDDQPTSDFELLTDDLHVQGEVESAPNPLRSGEPQRLREYRKEIHQAVIARRSGAGVLDR